MALPDITVQQLEYLDAAARNDTWAQAAASLGVSPSALSQGLAELERRLGVRLFDRQGRRRVPTVEHATVLDHARRVLAQTNDLVAWAQGSRGGRSGRVRVGMIDAAAVDRFPDVLRRFREGRPDVAFHLTVAPSESLLRQLVEGTLDLAVCVAPPSPVPSLRVTSVLREPLRLYAPDGRRAGSPDTWGPWVTFPVGSHTRDLIGEAIRAAGGRFDVVAESHQPDVLREMVRLGLGWTVLPASQAERAPSPLVPARKAPLLTRELVVALRADALPIAAVDQLREALLASGGSGAAPRGQLA